VTMGKAMFDLNAILAPIPGDNPAGEDLRYTDIYERIKEARRADDMLNQGDWQREVKRSDWGTVIDVAADALSARTKDIQIAVWLIEGLIRKQGFAGLNAGMTILDRFIRDFWDHVYPLAEDGDLEYRAGPLEFLNDKVSLTIREISLTDEKASEGFPWNKWQESRQVGYEKDTKNQYGDTDDNKLRARQGYIEEGRIAAETFDAAVSQSSKEFYVKLADDIDACIAAYGMLDAVVDERFGRDAPRLSDLQKACEDCQRVVNTILKDRGGRDIPAPFPAAPAAAPEPAKPKKGKAAKAAQQEEKMATDTAKQTPAQARQFVAPTVQYTDQASYEDAVWQGAQDTLASSGINPALTQLLGASGSAPSARQKNRYRLMMAKLALIAERPDIARPIVEELYALISELNLEKWESPLWIAEVIEAYYQCLTSAGASEDDRLKAENELFPKLCSLDITKALAYKKGG
jgi:type VI secretion system protein ImpA